MMMMTLVGIDEEKIRKDGYNPQDLWKWIDSVCAESSFSKEPQPDGTVLYAGSPDSENILGECFFIFRCLAHDEYFGKYCNKWIVYEKDDDSPSFLETNALETLRNDKNYPYFSAR